MSTLSASKSSENARSRSSSSDSSSDSPKNKCSSSSSKVRRGGLFLLGCLSAVVFHSLCSTMGVNILSFFFSSSNTGGSSSSSDGGGGAGGREGTPSGTFVGGYGGFDNTNADGTAGDGDDVGAPLKRVYNLSNYTFKTVSDPFEGFNVDLEMRNGLEFLKDAPAVYDYTRPERMRESHKPRSDGTEPVRVACLYAGFLRDFEKMFMKCGDEKNTHPNFCKHPKRRKFFGRQRDNIIRALDCDVFMSTWDIRGAGRFNTVTYDMDKTIRFDHVKGVYGPRMARLHAQNYSAYQPLWWHMYPYVRNFPQIHPTVGGTDRRGLLNWTGVHEVNPFIRVNDYSQSYKQWCVLQLVNRYSLHYDLYFRLRTDLRSTSRFMGLHFRTEEDTGLDEELDKAPVAEWDTFSKFTMAPLPPGETLSPEQKGLQLDSEAKGIPFEYNRSRHIIFQLQKVEDKEQRFCGKKDKKIARAKARAREEYEQKLEAQEDGEGSNDDGKGTGGGGGGGGKHPKRKKCDDSSHVEIPTNHTIYNGRIAVNDFGIGDFGFMGTPEDVTELAKLWYYCIQPTNKKADYVDPDDVSEYNLMLWHIVFTKKWVVDSGKRHLWVSRRGAMEAKKMTAGSNVLKILKGPAITLSRSGGSKTVSRKVKKKM